MRSRIEGVLGGLAAALLVAACAGEPNDEGLPLLLGGEIELEVGSPAIGRNSMLVESIGIETLGGVFTPLLESGQPVPCETVQPFSTATNGQTEIFVSFYRGRSELVRDAHSLGRLGITGFGGERAGEPKVDVFVRARGDDLLVRAVDRATGEALDVARRPPAESR